ncbi:hypothetical protein FACS1894216_13870 [Synergistales bacterium]|nr:hypothetical protein FACS1894216_13870 [Synergistales bacterium]
MIDMKTVGKRIRAIREYRHLTLEQLARIINRDKQTIWRWEKAERGVSLKTLNLLAEKLDCHPSFLLGQNDDINTAFDKNTGNASSNTPEPCTFGQNLRAERKNKGIPIEQFANLLAIPEYRVTELENMINAPPVDELARIVKALGVQESVLLKSSETWSLPGVPKPSVIELAQKMLEIDPYVNLYLRDIKPTNAEARFIAAAIRLAFERSRD